MSKRKPGLTRAQHQAIGAEARRMHSSLLTIGTTAANAYGKSNPRVVKVMRAAQRAVNALGTMRSELEALLAAQHADWKTTDYTEGHPKATSKRSWRRWRQRPVGRYPNCWRPSFRRHKNRHAANASRVSCSCYRSAAR